MGGRLGTLSSLRLHFRIQLAMGNDFQLPRVLQPGGYLTAVVEVVRYGDEVAVLKSFSGSRNWFRRTIGRYLISREVSAYQRIGGLPGVPRLLERVGPDAFLIEYLEARNCLDVESQRFRHAFFSELEDILDSIRSKGVFHCDVGRNVLFSSSGRPTLCDFASSILLPAWSFPRRNSLVRLRSDYDRRSVVKLKKKVAPQLLDRNDWKVLVTPLPFETSLIKPFERTLKLCVHFLERVGSRL